MNTYFDHLRINRVTVSLPEKSLWSQQEVSGECGGPHGDLVAYVNVDGYAKVANDVACPFLLGWVTIQD